MKKWSCCALILWCLLQIIQLYVCINAALLVRRSRDWFLVVSLDFSVTCSFRPYHGPGVDSVPSENEYQENFLGVKVADAWGWWPFHLHVPNVMKIWEPKPPGTLWATPGLLRDSFTVISTLSNYTGSFKTSLFTSAHSVFCSTNIEHSAGKYSTNDSMNFV